MLWKFFFESWWSLAASVLLIAVGLHILGEVREHRLAGRRANVVICHGFAWPMLGLGAWSAFYTVPAFLRFIGVMN